MAALDLSALLVPRYEVRLPGGERAYWADTALFATQDGTGGTSLLTVFYRPLGQSPARLRSGVTEAFRLERLSATGPSGGAWYLSEQNAIRSSTDEGSSVVLPMRGTFDSTDLSVQDRAAALQILRRGLLWETIGGLATPLGVGIQLGVINGSAVSVRLVVGGLVGPRDALLALP